MTTTDTVSQSTTATTTSRTAPTRTINVGGTPFAYRELGPPTGVPLVFLHHFTAVLDDWDPRVIDGIASKRHVIAFDNRGVGASGGSVPHTIDEMAADAVAFIRALSPTSKAAGPRARSSSRWSDARAWLDRSLCQMGNGLGNTTSANSRK